MRAAFVPVLAAAIAVHGCTLVLETVPHLDGGSRIDAHTRDVVRFDANGDRSFDVHICDVPTGCCSTDNDCTQPASCVAGACRIGCGGVGETCCDGLCGGARPCRPDGAGSNWCAPCGAPGEVCCLDGAPCAAGLTCTPLGAVGYCFPVAPITNARGGPCAPLPPTNCVDTCGVDPCGETARCEPTGADSGVCIACGLPGEPCCSGMLMGLPFYCPGITRCADQQLRTALCVPM